MLSFFCSIGSKWSNRLIAFIILPIFCINIFSVETIFADIDNTGPSVTINQKTSQSDPTTTSSALFTVVFSEPIDISSFTIYDISTSGSTAPGIIINSITQVVPNDGTTFEVSISASGTGNIVANIPEKGGYISSILGKTGSNPHNMVIDSIGNLYTANTTNNNVTKITPTGISSILGTTGLNPRGIAIDSTGNIYTANQNSNDITKITPTGVSSILGKTGNHPWGITVDSVGNIYTANSRSGNVTKITPTGESLVLGTTGIEPVGIAIDSIGNIYTTNVGSKNVTKITPTGESSILGSIGNDSHGIIVDSVGNAYITNLHDNNVTKITPTGISSVLGTTGGGPHNMIMDSSGNIYTANSGSGNVTKITPAGLSSVLGATGNIPVGISMDSFGNTYTSNWGDNSITKIFQSDGIKDFTGNSNYASTSVDNIVTISNSISGSTSNINSTITIINPNILAEQTKTITASVNSGTVLTMAINNKGVNICDSSISFGAYSGTIFTTEADNGKRICYRAIDATGGISYAISSAIEGIDKIPPIITLSGPKNVIVNAGSIYIDSGATFFDNVDGTGSVVASGTVDIKTLGTYTLTYTKRDIAGNVANPVIRSVSVIANIPQTSSSGSSKQADNSTVSISDCSSGNNFETYYNKKFLNSTTTNSIISFPDINDSFAVNDIKMLAKYKIIKGYADGNFKPNFGTSRAEFLSTVMKSLGIKINSGITTDFTDMPSDGGQAKYIAKAQELGIAQGQVIDGKLKFRPNDL
ncbi:MAG: S-layer homology domain-containing protein, partial [Candidatus Gracilibacteria bacterium]|nr:S-layer homology domain-containing protein [Candidatus Gracilibacteria bacterium]